MDSTVTVPLSVRSTRTVIFFTGTRRPKSMVIVLLAALRPMA